MRRMIPIEEWNKLSDETKALLEGFSSDDASTKKIYCHPLQIINLTDTGKCSLTCLVFNNDPTRFTLASFKDFIDNLMTKINQTVTIMMSGYWNDGTTEITSASYFFKSISNGDYGIAGGLYNSTTISTKRNASWEVIFGTNTTLTDSVNALN